MNARPVQSTIKEKRHRLILLGGIGSVVTGFILFGSGHLGLSVVGFIVLIFGITTLIVSKLGKQWAYLPGNKKAMIAPGVVTGVGGIIIGMIFLYALWYAFKSEILRD